MTDDTGERQPQKTGFRDGQAQALLHRATISLGDIVEARQALYLHEPREPDQEPDAKVELRNHFLVAYAVIAYCRPFVESRGDGAPFLTFGQMGLKLSPEMGEQHRRLVDLRKRALAHSDEDLRPAQIVKHDEPGVILPKGTLAIRSRSGFSFVVDLQVETFLELAERVHVGMIEFIRELQRILGTSEA